MPTAGREASSSARQQGADGAIRSVLRSLGPVVPHARLQDDSGPVGGDGGMLGALNSLVGLAGGRSIITAVHGDSSERVEAERRRERLGADVALVDDDVSVLAVCNGCCRPLPGPGRGYETV